MPRPLHIKLPRAAGMAAAIALFLPAGHVAAPATAAEPAGATNRIGMHSILSPTTPQSAKEVMFWEAKPPELP